MTTPNIQPLLNHPRCVNCGHPEWAHKGSRCSATISERVHHGANVYPCRCTKYVPA